VWAQTVTPARPIYPFTLARPKFSPRAVAADNRAPLPSLPPRAPDQGQLRRLVGHLCHPLMRGLDSVSPLGGPIRQLYPPPPQPLLRRARLEIRRWLRHGDRARSTMTAPIQPYKPPSQLFRPHFFFPALASSSPCSHPLSCRITPPP
jgi:hypothetical protein